MRLFPVILFLLVAPALHAASQGYTLDEDLLYRINFGSSEDVRLLLERGANPNAKSTQGETALSLALERNGGESEDMARALIEQGADISKPDKSGNTPIVNAVKYKQPAIVQLLLEKGVSFHISSGNGLPLIEYAKLNGDPESTKLIQTAVDKETAYINSMHSPQRYKDLVRKYTMDGCLFQYWSYILDSRQIPEKDSETRKKIEDIRVELADLGGQIRQFYSVEAVKTVQDISDEAVQRIYKAMDSLISNRNRAEYGIGHEDDAQKRCSKIVDEMRIDFIPDTTSKNPFQGTPAPESSPPAATAPSTLKVPAVPVKPTALPNR